ncbi:MAG: single-stranded DNA-binding protein [Aeriscardovia sp.]|nr:single-stranded DNA-binding protein [Aeriscardovia sp.]
MANETVITVVGNLTGDPELRTIASGAQVVNFTVASTPRTLDRTTQQWKDGEALFLRCSAWRDAAEHIAQSLTKGTRVIVQGRLVQRSYTTQQGEKRSTIELQVDEIGPSLRYATAQVQRVPRASGYNGGYGSTTPAGYSGGTSAPTPATPAAMPQPSSEPWAAYGDMDTASGFGTSGTTSGADALGVSDDPGF